MIKSLAVYIGKFARTKFAWTLSQSPIARAQSKGHKSKPAGCHEPAGRIRSAIVRSRHTCSATYLHLPHPVTLALDPRSTLCPMASLRKLGVGGPRSRVVDRTRRRRRRRIIGYWRWWIIRRRRGRRWRIVTGWRRRIISRRGRGAVGDGATDDRARDHAAEQPRSYGAAETAGIRIARRSQRREADARRGGEPDERFIHVFPSCDRSGADPNVVERKSPVNPRFLGAAHRVPASPLPLRMHSLAEVWCADRIARWTLKLKEACGALAAPPPLTEDVKRPRSQ
jgi:hypothetical protein